MLSWSHLSLLRQPNLSSTSSFLMPALTSVSSIPNSGFDRHGLSMSEIHTLPIQHGNLHPSYSSLSSNSRSIQSNSGLSVKRSSKTDNSGLRMEISQGIPNAMRRNPRSQLSKANMLTKLGSNKTENSKRLGDFMRNHSERVKSMLSKKLYVRELVKIRPGSDLERQLEGNDNRVGVLMKHSGKFRVGSADEVIMEQDMLLTIRLRDGSWLKKVRVEDVESLGKRATLTEYLRIGDILLTRFGVAVARQLHPSSAQVTVEFRGEFVDRKKFSLRERNEILAELRRVLNDETDWKDDEHVLTTSFSKPENYNFSEETKDEPMPRSASLATNLLEIREEGPSKVDLTDKEVIITRHSDDDSNRRPPNIDVGETKSRRLDGYNRFSKDENKTQEDEHALNADIPSIDQSTFRNRNHQGEIIEKIGVPNAFERNSLVLTGADINLRELPNLPESANCSEHVQKSESFVLPKLDMKHTNSDKVNYTVIEKVNSVSKIHDTDIKTVFSAAEVFDRIEKKVVQDFFATVNAHNLKNPRPSLAFKNEQLVTENLNENNEIRKTLSSNMSSISYNDRIVSPHSDRSSKPGDVKVDYNVNLFI